MEHHDSWGLGSRGAMLGVGEQDFAALVTAVPAILTCDAACLFALQQSAQLLGVPAPQLLLQAPELLNTPSTLLQQCIEELEQVLQLPRPAVVALLRREPQVACGGRRALGGLLRRHCASLLLSGAEGAALLGWLLASLAPAAKLSDLGSTQQQVRELSGLLMLTPPQLLAALRAEERAFGTTAPLAELLQSSGEAAAAWSRLCEEVGVPQQEVMQALVQQMTTPQPRYSLRSAAAVAADLKRLQAACQLAPPVLLRMLLAAPALVAVPASFWGLLFQYLLFLMPHWRQQLDAMPAAEAAAIIVELFYGSASDDLVPVAAGDSLFATADSDFSQELRVLAALLDQGTPAPRSASERHIRAGRAWRLIYLCNPRISAAQQHHVASSSSASPWSWVAKLQLPAALLQQLQQRGALQCELPQQSGATNPHATRDGNASSAGASSSRAACVGEAVEGLAEVVAAPTADFIARHPGYSHWLHHTTFELEWSASRAAVPIQTWDC